MNTVSLPLSRLRMEEAALPPNWPPLAPRAFMERLRDGYILFADELAQLQQDAEDADRLEQEDPAFARVARRYRAQWAEDVYVEELRRKLDEKTALTAQVADRRKRELSELLRDREQKQRRRDMSRKEAEEARERHRAKLEERLTLAERRTLVRETIQRALLSQNRSEGHAERVYFTDPKFLGDAPGPAAYELPSVPPTKPAASFAVHPPTEVKKVEQYMPGPGAYDPGQRPDVHRSRKSSFGLLLKPKRDTAVDEPGPASYDVKLPAKSGGTISRSSAPSDVELAMKKSVETPGPGTYELHSLASVKSSTITGRTRNENDLMLAMAARRPGPGAYDMPGVRVRGGAMEKGVRTLGSSLPSIAPGPGAYMKTPTVQQEREMEKLSRQVVVLVRQRQGEVGSVGGGSASAPTNGRRRGLPGASLGGIEE